MPANAESLRSQLLWALWEQIPEATTPTSVTESVDSRALISEDKVLTSKLKPAGNAWPTRPLLYANCTRIKALHNEFRAKFCSMLPSLPEVDNAELDIQHKPLEEHVVYNKPENTGDTFLTEMSDYVTMYDSQATTQANVKVPLPAFLPTIQAKTSSIHRQTKRKKTEQVRKYLDVNELYTDPIQQVFARTNTPVKLAIEYPTAPPHIAGLESQIIAEHNNKRHRRAKSLDNKPTKPKHKTRVRATGNKGKKHGRIYVGSNRALSVPLGNDSTREPRIEDLVNHFSRISMRQVQATLNQNRFSIGVHSDPRIF